MGLILGLDAAIDDARVQSTRSNSNQRLLKVRDRTADG
jgi:hypothetical protein